MEAKIHNGEKIISSINSVGETGQILGNEWNLTTISHHVQKYIQKALKTWM